ncbi:MAG TPA: ATP-binding protein [Nodularia sp. (in: cyanobacteria)]|nr:ATP-binding protein [Nodularia sp. (in: cyanobacteria)]
MQDQKKIDDHLADQQLEDGRHRHPKIATVSEGMILQLADGTIPACNTMAEIILGLTVEEIHEWNLPESSWRFVHQNGTPLTAVTHPGMVALRTGKPCLNFVVGLSKPNTDLKWLLMNSQPLFLANETSPYAVLYTFSNITQEQAQRIEDNSGDRNIINQDITQNPKIKISPETADAEVVRRLAENEPHLKKLLDSNINGIVLANFEKNIEANDIFLESALCDQSGKLISVQEYTRQINGLMEAALAINSALSIEEVIRIMTEQAREIIGAHQAFTTMTIDEDSTNLMSWASLSDKYAAWRDQHQQRQCLGIYNNLHLINRSVRMTQAELEAHPQWQQFTQQIDKHPPMRGCLAAPLIGRNGQNIGLIQLSDQYEDEFTKEDEAIIVQLAQMASVAIENTRLYKAEQQARAQAEKANCIKDEFLAVLSHELRSPLNPILGWSKLLQSRKFDATKTASALATIERNAKLQAQLIEDLLDVSQILQGKLILNVDQVNLGLTISAAMQTVHLAAEAKSINLKFLSNTDSTALVMGDFNRLQQVFWNLLSNAVKFTPPGGRVQICLERIDSHIQIQVMDTGKGIDPHFLAHVFDYFRQADSATTRKFGGLGLGLAIVRQLVELHGGRVFADSAGEGQGATFTVQLPALQTQLITLNSHSEAEMDSNLGNLQGIKILVVDDDLDSRDFICFVLEEEGAEVISVSSAIEALKTLPESKADVLLSDIGMPEMDGYMLMRQVRTWTSEQGGKTPAIALTAYAGEYNQQQAMSAGFQMHVTKPAEPSQLVAAVARLAGKQVISH